MPAAPSTGHRGAQVLDSLYGDTSPGTTANGGDTTAQKPFSISSFVMNHPETLIGGGAAALGLVPSAGGALIRSLRGSGKTYSTQQNIARDAAKFKAIRAQYPEPFNDEISGIGPAINAATPVEVPKEPSLVRYTKSQVLSPALSSDDLAALGANNASRVQRNIAELADVADRNARLSKGYATTPSGLYAPLDLSVPSAPVVPPVAPPVAPLSAMATRPVTPAISAFTNNPDAVREMAQAYRARVGMTNPDVYTAARTYPEAVGTAAALEDSRSALGRVLSQAGRFVPAAVADTLGAAGAGMSGYNTYKDLRAGNYGHAAVDTLSGLGGLAAVLTESPAIAAGGLALGIPAALMGMYDYQNSANTPTMQQGLQNPAQ
jgi:hypothetical protein